MTGSTRGQQREASGCLRAATVQACASAGALRAAFGILRAMMSVVDEICVVPCAVVGRRGARDVRLRETPMLGRGVCGCRVLKRGQAFSVGDAYTWRKIVFR